MYYLQELHNEVFCAFLCVLWIRDVLFCVLSDLPAVAGLNIDFIYSGLLRIDLNKPSV